MITGEKRTLTEIVAARATSHATQRAYTFLECGEHESACLTWADLERRSRAIAVTIRASAPPAARVLLLFPPGLDFIPAFFGSLRASTIAVPAYPPSGHRADRVAERLRGMAVDAGISLVLAPTTLAGRRSSLVAAVPELAHLPWIDPCTVPDSAADDWHDSPSPLDDVVLLQYTSGSTASPRGVMVTQANLLHNLARSARLAGHDASSASVSWLPINHDMGLVDGVLQPAFSGFPAWLMAPASFLQRPVRWLQAISRVCASHSGGPDFAYALCAARVTETERRALDLSTWRTAYNGSEPVRRSTLEAFQRAFGESGFRWESFRPSYGLAEATLLVTSGTAGDGPAVCVADPDALRRGRLTTRRASRDGVSLVASGRIDDTVAIVDPRRTTRCDADRVGEIWVQGGSVAAGYWGRGAETSRTFGAVLADTGEGPYLRTGDLGVVHDGHLYVTGRLKDVIILRGLKHYPHDIEQTAERAHHGVRPGSCAAFAVDGDAEERLVLIAELDTRNGGGESVAGGHLDVLAAIRQAIVERHGIALSALVLVAPGTLPRTTSGKLRRYLCRDAYLSKSLSALDSWTSSGSLTLERAAS